MTFTGSRHPRLPSSIRTHGGHTGSTPMSIARAIAIFCCFAVALLSKEQGMLLPGLLLILAISLRLQRRNSQSVIPVELPHDILNYSDLNTSRADLSAKQATQWLAVL